MDANRDRTFKAAETRDVIQDFMSRPVKIHEATWLVGETLSDQINPWTLYFEDDRILPRIANFQNLTCDLEIKVLINGNPFYYGLGMVSYIPLFGNDRRTPFTDLNPNLILYSQMPRIFLDPTVCQGGDLNMTYFHPRNAINIPSREWRTMGLVQITSLAPLRHANNGSKPLTISVFAMAKNVDISTPTGLSPLDNQADEYEKPSAIAHTVAKSIGYLARAPVIGPYARATAVAVSQFGDLARLFGFSRPRYTAIESSVRPRFSANLAVTNVQDNIEALALDAKKEVTVDPRVVGLTGEDEMALVPLASKESYLTTFDWPAAAASGQHLFSIRISPLQGVKLGENFYITPSAWVTLPFQYWKGSMRVRFNVVASGYHRGRIRLVWDPSHNTVANALNFNTNYSTVVDISELKDIIIKVGWGQDRSYLPHGGLESAALNHTMVGEFTSGSLFCNGVLSAYVVNELTAPADPASDVSVAVFTSMCDDFEIACPDSSLFKNVAIVKTDPIDPEWTPPPTTPTDPVVPPLPDYSQPVNRIDCTTGPGITTNPQSFGGISSPFAITKIADRSMTFLDNVWGVIVPYTVLPGVLELKTKVKFQVINPTGQAIRNYSVTAKLRPYNTATFTAQQSVMSLSMTDGPFEASFALPCSAHGLYEIQFEVDGAPGYKDFFVQDLWFPEGVGKIQKIVNFSATNVTYDAKGMDVTPWYGKMDMPIMWDPKPLTIAPTSGLITTTFTFGELIINLTPFQTDQTKIPFYLNVAQHSGYTAGSNHALGSIIYADNTRSVVDNSSMKFLLHKPVGTGASNCAMPVLVVNNTSPEKIISKLSISPGVQGAWQPLHITSVAWFEPQNAITRSIEDYAFVDPLPNQSLEIPMAPSCPDAKANMIHFGEYVTSWRQVLKRYVHSNLSQSESGQLQLFDSDVHVEEEGPLAIWATTPLDYVRAAYVGYRGGYRVRAMVVGKEKLPLLGEIRITRLSSQAVRQRLTTGANLVGWDGSTRESLHVSPVADAEIPYYSNLRFYPARLGTNDDVYTSLDNYAGRERTFYAIYVSANQSIDLEVTQAIAEDFSLHFFLCTPVLKLSA